jgi:P-loop containing dynein motor region D4
LLDNFVFKEKSDIYLEDLNHLLCMGEIPNLINAEEQSDIIEKMGEIDKQRDKTVQVMFSYEMPNL